ncbi:MAG: TonB-dependent receptor [Saprospiraceae bacterium]|nr:MAG: TonB-dependent receptor [Saprospiraceae bacterium]
MKLRLLTLFLLLANTALFSQKITGKITDSQSGEPLSYATISLYNQADSTLVDGTITDDAGVFEVTAKPGLYFAKIDFLAYEPYLIDKIEVKKGGAKIDLGNIELYTATATLDEVVVQAEKSTMQLALDKKVFNVGKDLANSGNNAADILDNIPSVSVDIEGNVSLRGSTGVRILIDGKPSGLMSFSGAQGLRLLQGNQIDRVEIITNPSARYEGEGVGGIINIILKKERRQGLNGAFDVIVGYPTNYGGSANVNFRKDKLNFFLNYGITYNDTPVTGKTYQETERNDTLQIYDSRNERNQKGINNSIRGGLDYYFTSKDILTASYTWRRSKGDRTSFLTYNDYLFSSDNLTGFSTRTQDEEETEPNSEYSLTYKKTFKREGQEFTVDARYQDNWEESDQNFEERIFLPDGTANGAEIFDHSYNYETEKRLLLQADYIHPFKKDGRFEIGLYSSFREMTNNYIVEHLADGKWLADPGLTNHFIYNENIHAAYAQVGNKINRFSYQLGLRAEYSDVTTKLLQTEDVNPRDYLNLIPTAHFTYDLPNENAIQLSYSRRIRRPRYWDLSPFSTFTDNRNFFSGNPDLNPELTHSFEIGHVKYMENASISSSIYYRYTLDEIERIRRVDENGNSFTRPENLATENAYGVELTGSYSPYKWWKVDGNFNFFRSITDGDILDQNFYSDTYGWRSRFTSRFTFWKNTDLQVRWNYRSRSQTTQGYRLPSWSLDLGVSKDILNKNATLTLNVRDLFNTRRWRSITEGENFYSFHDGQWRTRQINLTFSYRLHQQKKRPDRRSGGEGDGVGDED